MNRIRQITVLTKYITEIRKEFLQGINNGKRDGELSMDYNKKIIPIGKLFLFLFNLNKTN